MAGDKTHEQQLRTIERKDDVPKAREADAALERAGGQDAVSNRMATHPEARQSDLPVSRGGTNQESRDHNKHNHSGQSGHKPQKHSPAEEKH